MSKLNFILCIAFIYCVSQINCGSSLTNIQETVNINIKNVVSSVQNTQNKIEDKFIILNQTLQNVLNELKKTKTNELSVLKDFLDKNAKAQQKCSSLFTELERTAKTSYEWSSSSASLFVEMGMYNVKYFINNAETIIQTLEQQKFIAKSCSDDNCLEMTKDEVNQQTENVNIYIAQLEKLPQKTMDVSKQLINEQYHLQFYKTIKLNLDKVYECISDTK